MKRYLVRVLPFTVIVPVCFLLLAAQETKKSTSVTLEVIDPSGAPIPKAQTEVISVETARAKSSATDDMGRVQIELEQGSYDVIVSGLGFKTLNHQIHVNGDASQKFALTLLVGVVPRQTHARCTQIPARHGGKTL
jgi:hypothetical protein